ncbi:TPA: DnaT-like ssDNA-binding domain-containing protein [Pseudomonas putida]
MPSFQINDAEWGALADEPADVFKLYCAIRRFMDYRTGVSGEKRRLSEQMFREELYIAPIRGRHESGSPTRQKVRSLVDRLISIGVVSQIGPLVFELPHADWDGSSKTSATDEQPHQQPYQQPIENPPEAPESLGSDDGESGSATGSESGQGLISNLPPISVKSPTTHNARGYFAMQDGWQPQAKTWGPTALRNAIPKAVPADHLNEFRSYWIARPEKEQSQAQWEHQLAQSLKHHIRQAQAGGYSHGSQGPAQAETNQQRPNGGNGDGSNGRYRRQSRSAPDQVRDAIAERERQAEAFPEEPGHSLAEDGGDVRPPLDVEFWRVG